VKNVYNLYKISQEEMPIFWKVIVSVILSKKVYKYMSPIPNGFRDKTISLSTIKKLLIFNTGIYCSSDKVGTV
jgi:hypothetical protein